MGFMDAVKSVYGQYATFSGRAGRSEYWWFQLFFLLVMLVVYVPMLVLMSGDGSSVGLVLALALLAFTVGSIIPSIAVSVRRLHDSGKSGWFYFVNFIPFVGGIIFLVLMVLPSEGANQYGPQP